MNRRSIGITVLILLGALYAGYGLMHWWEREQSIRAGKQALQKRQRMLEQMAEQHPKLVAEATNWLDEWPGQGDLLVKAEDNLRRVLKADPENASARIQMARYILNAGYISDRAFQPGAISRAEHELKLALEVDPNSADALLLLAHTYSLSGRSKEALKALKKAEAIGTKNPWLYVNWADALMQLNRLDEAETRLREALAQLIGVPRRRPIRAMREKLADVYVSQRKLDDADREYQAALAADPTYAWVRGNYAGFLLFRRGMPDAAIAEAEKTIEMMDYGMVRMVLATARYAKWAEVKRRSPQQAAQYLASARAASSDFSWIMPQSAKSVSASPVIQNLVRELMTLGVPLDTKTRHGDTGLMIAAYLGDVESVAILLKLGADIEAADPAGYTPLALAVYKGHIEVAGALVARGANVNSMGAQWGTPLMIASINEDKGMMAMLISLKADANITASDGSTPLFSVAHRGNEELVRLLLEAGADPSRRLTKTQQTAADIAMSQGHAAVAALIREAAEKRGAARQ
jgi:Tfp pilus assembly protein PilF